MFRTVREDKERLSLDEDNEDEDGVVVLSAPFSGGLPIPAVLLDVVLAGVAAGSARDDGVREGVAGTAQREGERERLAAAGDPPSCGPRRGRAVPLFEESLRGVAVTAAAPRLREAADGVALELPLSAERTSIVAIVPSG